MVYQDGPTMIYHELIHFEAIRYAYRFLADRFPSCHFVSSKTCIQSSPVQSCIPSLRRALPGRQESEMVPNKDILGDFADRMYEAHGLARPHARVPGRPIKVPREGHEQRHTHGKLKPP